MDDTAIIPDTRFLPPLKADDLQRRYRQLQRRDISGADRHERAIITPRGQMPGEYLNPAPGRVVEDCDFCADISAAPTDTALPVIDKRVAYCGYMRFQWGHFLLNTTARLWWALSHDSEVDNYVFCVAPDEQRPLDGNYREFFELLGIADKVMLITEPTAFAHVVVPEPAMSFEVYWSPQSARLFSHVVAEALKRVDADATPHRGIVLSRGSLPKARQCEVGIAEIESTFAAAGYRIVPPERLSLSEMIAMMQGANSIVAFSGSTAHNLVFARPGQKSVILERTAINNIFQPIVASLSGSIPIHVEASFSPERVASGLGPFLYYPTPWLVDFLAHEGIDAPAIDASTSRRLVDRYYRSLIRLYRWRRIDESWSDDQRPHVEQSRAMAREKLHADAPRSLWRAIHATLFRRR